MLLLKVDKLSFAFAEASLIQQLSIELDIGDTLAVVGANGTGKTTLLRVLIGYYSISKGQVWICGKDIQQSSKKELSKYYAYVPQEVEAYPGISVRQFFDNLENKNVLKCLADFKLELFLDRAFYSLSGGERQRVLLASALSRLPRLIIADELTKGLDAETSRFLGEYLKQYCKENSAGAILTSHDAAWIESYCNKKLSLRNSFLCKF